VSKTAPLYIPSATGADAVAASELDHVPWETLAHAYGVGAAKAHGNVRASLASLADDVGGAADELFGNICHQGTTYEATAYAVPYIAAFAAGADLDEDGYVAIASLLATIGHSASFEAPSGSHWGSFGEGVGPRTREAFRACGQHLRAFTKRHPRFAPIDAALIELGESTTPDEALVEELEELAYGDEE